MPFFCPHFFESFLPMRLFQLLMKNIHIYVYQTELAKTQLCVHLMFQEPFHLSIEQ